VYLTVSLSCQTILSQGTNGIRLKNTSLKDTLSTPDPSPEARALYRYLLDMNGQLTLSGQQWVQWGIHELDYLETTTGKLPAIAGFDYINSDENAVENVRAREWWESGGIPTIMWHWGAPTVGDGYTASKGTINIDNCFIEGTPEYIDFWDELETKADLLEVLRDSGVPVLWRPLHELNGGWFWWSKDGPEAFKQIWTTMFDYFVHERGLNNLIWVLCYTDIISEEWYPGDEYVDAVGGDTYDGTDVPHRNMYNNSKEIAGDNNFPICFHECGIPPDMDKCLEDGIIWSWWMIWHTGHLEGIDTDYLTRTFNHDMVITRDELPDILSLYNWEESCLASEISPSVQINGGDWQDTSNIIVGAGWEILLNVSAEGDGTWNWEGCGTSGNSTEQTITSSETCAVTARYMNDCGATSTRVFNILVDPGLSGVDQVNTDKNTLVALYPLPCKEELTVELFAGRKSLTNRISVYSPDGAKILEKTAVSDKLILDVSALPQGIYFITIENSEFHVTKKIFKVN
jgi:hypothetical protein